MLPDRVSNPGPLTYESGALPIALRGPARLFEIKLFIRLTVRVFRERLSICVCSSFPSGFERGLWGSIVLLPLLTL